LKNTQQRAELALSISIVKSILFPTCNLVAEVLCLPIAVHFIGKNRVDPKH